MTDWIELDYRDPETGEPVPFAQYEIHFQGGAPFKGKLDAAGRARHENVQRLPVSKVIYLPRRPDDEGAAPALAKITG